jgi:peptide deformylase
MINIVQKGDPVLRLTAKEVPVSEIKSQKIQKIIAEMKQAISEQADAVAIAAPQIGEPYRIFVISGKIFAKKYPDIEPGTIIPEDVVCINPKILKLSKKKEPMTEGCLSVRWLYGTTMRSTKAVITAFDEHGQEFTRGGAGLLAQIFQHEIDHLNGILFVDTATEIEESLPEQN